MMGRSLKVVMNTRGIDEFRADVLADARRLDRGEVLEPCITLSFETAEEMATVLARAKLELLRQIRRTPGPIGALAKALNRDRAAVNRDVSLLARLGLVSTSLEPNPGHGRHKVVRPVAAEIEVVARI